MAVLAHFLVISAFILGLFHVEAKEGTLSTEDSSFCYGGLQVVYPEVDIDKCLVIPTKHRNKITNIWKAPQVYFPEAHKDKMYVLVMVDPDAPSHDKPTAAHWRHWLVADIQGKALKKGQIQETILTAYFPPSPPKRTGLHRYQFMLFEQPDAPVSLTKEETSRGKWDLQAFTKRFDLGKPVATVQFLTQNYED